MWYALAKIPFAPSCTPLSLDTYSNILTPSSFHSQLLEVLLQHWAWMRSEMTREYPSTPEQMETYVEHFLQEGADLSEEIRVAAIMPQLHCADEVIATVRGIFQRYLLSAGSVASFSWMH